MISTELHFIVYILIISFSIINASAGRCYLCSEATLVECAGSNQPDSSIYTTVLQYYTEPCNGQCVLFRNENRSIIRGCSWTYGHMTSKSIGWHEISPGIKAYFCESHLCNNGTYEQPELTIRRIGLINNQIILSAQELFVLAGSNPSLVQTGQYLPRQLYQCYSCTARFQGCGEYLDPHYASNYILPCPSSCIIFRNPNDLNLITRDCSTFWPQVRAKSGLQKLLGSDAFFCQESLCNGISFDFIMGIFHNQIPVVITLPSIPINEDISTPTTTTTIKATIDIRNDSAVWDDPDLDYDIIESTIPAISNNFTTSSISNNHSDFMNEISPSSTIVSDVSIAQSNSSLNGSDFNDTSLSLSPLTSTSVSSTIQNDLIIFNTSSILPVTRFEHLAVDDNIEDYNEDMEQITDDLFAFNIESNSDILSPTLTTTSVMNLINNTQLLNPFNIIDNKPEDPFLEYMKPFPTLAMPPFSWMLNIASQNRSEVQNSTTTTTTKEKFRLTTTTKQLTTTTEEKVQLTTTTSKNPNTFFEYCQNKQCYHGGRLNSDCLCICLPAITGDNCETVLCEQEPVHICTFVLEHECEIDHIRYLCPKFCQINSCSSKKI